MESPIRSVLLVEDDADVQLLVKTFLSRSGSAVDTAADGEQAIAKLHEKHYDIVVLDLMLPKANGFEVAQAIGALDRPPRIVVLSAIARYFADRFPPGTTVIQKPFELDKLAAAVAGTSATR